MYGLTEKWSRERERKQGNWKIIHSGGGEGNWEIGKWYTHKVNSYIGMGKGNREIGKWSNERYNESEREHGN